MTRRLGWLLAGVSLGFLGAGALAVVGAAWLRRALPL